MFIAEVLSIDADEKYIDEKGAFDISKCDLIAYANGGYYPLGKKIGQVWIFGSKEENKKNKKYTSKRKNYKKSLRNTLLLLTYLKKHGKIFKRMYEILHGSHRFKETISNGGV